MYISGGVKYQGKYRVKYRDALPGILGFEYRERCSREVKHWEALQNCLDSCKRRSQTFQSDFFFLGVSISRAYIYIFSFHVRKIRNLLCWLSLGLPRPAFVDRPVRNAEPSKSRRQQREWKSGAFSSGDSKTWTRRGGGGRRKGMRRRATKRVRQRTPIYAVS